MSIHVQALKDMVGSFARTWDHVLGREPLEGGGIVS